MRRRRGAGVLDGGGQLQRQREASGKDEVGAGRGVRRRLRDALQSFTDAPAEIGARQAADVGERAAKKRRAAARLCRVDASGSSSRCYGWRDRYSMRVVHPGRAAARLGAAATPDFNLVPGRLRSQLQRSAHLYPKGEAAADSASASGMRPMREQPAQCGERTKRLLPRAGLWAISATAGAAPRCRSRFDAGLPRCLVAEQDAPVLT